MITDPIHGLIAGLILGGIVCLLFVIFDQLTKRK